MELKTGWKARPRGCWPMLSYLVGVQWPQRSIFGPILFNIISDLDDGANLLITEITEEWPIHHVVHSNQVTHGTRGNLMKFNKCKILLLRRNNLCHQYMAGGHPAGKQLCRKGIKLNTKLKMSQLCASAARKANGNGSWGLGCASTLLCDTLTLRLGCNQVKSNFKQIWNYLKSKESASKDTRTIQIEILFIVTVGQQTLCTSVVGYRKRMKKAAFWLPIADARPGSSQSFGEKGGYASLQS